MDNLRDQLYSTGQETQSAPIGDFGTGKWVQSLRVHSFSLCRTRLKISMKLEVSVNSGHSIGEL